jgi:hypothetical protein
MKLSSNQKLLYELLGRIEPKASQAYLGALEVLEYDHKDKLHQSANSIRHAIAIITRGVSTKDAKGKKDEEDIHKKKIRKLVDPLVGLPADLDFQIQLLIDQYHEWFTGVAHYAKFPTERQYRRKFAAMEEVLLKIVRPHFDVIAEMQWILENDKPSFQSLRKVEALLARNFSCYDYFFREASDDWLPFLARNRYFDRPQHLIKGDEGAKYGFVPPSLYLARIAENKPIDVLRLILAQKIPSKEERNPIVLENFVLAATKMLSKYARRIAQKVSKKRWVDVIYFSSIDERVAELMVKLSNDGYHRDAVSLAHTLLDVKLSEPDVRGGILEEVEIIHRVIPKIDDYSYKQVLQSKLPILARNDPKTLISLLVYLLNKSIHLENIGYNQKDSKNDISLSWRPAIENSSQNMDFDFRSGLVEILRDSLVAEGNKDIRRLKGHLKLISEKQYPFFRRLELHIYRRFSNQFRHKIERAIIDYFDKPEMHHEYYHLVKDTFPILSKRTRLRFLRMVERGPDKKTIKYWKQKQEIYPRETVELKRRIWTLHKLYPIGRFLDGRLKVQYDNMIKEFGAPEHADFGFWHSGVMSAEPSTNLADNLDPDAVINFVKSYKLQESDFPVYDGTKQKFQEYVEKSPLEFSKKALALETADSMFVYALLSGLKNALKLGKEISWNEPLSLSIHLLTATSRDGNKKLASCDILDAIADLIQEGLKSDKVSPSFSLCNTIWQILVALTPSGSEEEQIEQNFPKGNWNAIDVSINTTSGKTFHAILEYALWCNKYLKKDKKTEFVLEVKTIIEDYFAKKISNTPSRHAVLGWQFPNLIYLDHDWTINNLSKIFPKDDKRLTRAAWDAYLHRDVLPWAFREVVDLYSNHIKNLKDPVLVDGRLTSVDEYVIEHVTIAFLFDLSIASALFEELKSIGNDLSLQHCAWTVSRILQRHKENPYKSLNLQSIKKIWEDESLSRQKEIDWWFAYSPFDKVATMNLFLQSLRRAGGEIGPSSTIQTQLQSYVKELPLKTAQCLELIIKSKKNRETLYAVRRTVTRDLLQALLQSKDRRTIKKTEELIHFLGSLGFNEYGELLN